MFFACRLVALLAIVFLVFSRESRAAIVVFTYDVNGNPTSQQTVTAAAPVILGSTPSQVVASGDIGGFSVTVASSLAVTYQWYRNGVAIGGATGDSLLLSNITSATDGNYTVTVTNSSGSVTSSIYRLGFDGSGNGLPDFWEQAFFGNLNQTAGGDFDGDSISNLDEYFDGTDPTVREVYYWIAQSGDFNNGANWNRNRVPGAGDTAVINTGTFTLPANATIHVSQVTVNVPFTVPTNFLLYVTGNWTFNGPFTLAKGVHFSVGGSGGVVAVTGTTSLNDADVFVFNGGKLSLSSVHSYTLPANRSVHWSVEGAGSELIFPSLSSINGSAAPNRYFDISARDGGKVSLPALTTITKPNDGDAYANSGVRLYVHNGSLLSVPQLSTFQDNDIHPDSLLFAFGATGTIQMPLLLAPVGVQINLNAASHPEQFTSLTGTRILEVNNGTVNISKLASFAGFAFVKASGGAKVTFSNLSGYTLQAGLTVSWIAEGTGSELIFSNLASITGSATPDCYLDIIGRYEGKVYMPALTTITKPNDGDPYANSGVRLYAYDDSLLSVSQLSSFQDNDIHPNSLLYASGSTGVIQMPLLLAPVGVQINLNAASRPEQFTSLIGTRIFEVNNGTVNISKLTSFAGFTFLKASGGAKVTFSNLSSYTLPAGLNVDWIAEGAGSELIFSNLASISGNAVPDCYLDIIAQYEGKVSLPVLTTITKPNDGDAFANSGVRLYAHNGSLLSAPQLSSFQDNDIHPNSLLLASGTTGTIQMPLLLAPVGVQINLNAASHPDQFVSLAGTRNLEVNNGSVNLTNLTSLAGFTFLKAGGGAKVTFPNVRNYTVPAGLSVTWIAEGVGSELIFSNLGSINGSVTPGYYFDVVAQHEGAVRLPSLTKITKPHDGDVHANSGIRLYAQNASLISAPQLSSFQDNDIHPNSLLFASGSTGTLHMPLLLAPVGVQINLNAASHPEQFTSLAGTRSLEFNNGTINISKLSSLASFTFVKAGGGARVTFSNVSSYTLPAGLNVDWIAEGAGSELIFSNLASINGSTTPDCYLDIVAQYDGKVSLPALTTITKPSDGDPYANSGVRLYAHNGALLSAPRLAAFHDNDIHPNSLLYASSNGMMILTSLAQTGIRGVTLDGVTLPDTVPAPKAINLSTRMLVQTGDNVGIGGFIITGSTAKRVIIRAIGPSLTGFGLPNALADPVIELHGPSAFTTITNDNWRDTQQTEIEATGIPPTHTLESAIVATLVPGPYTAIVRGNGGTSGVGLVEVYDLNQAVDAKLANLSTRAAVSTGDNIVIAGFVLSIGSGSDRIVVRGLGPSLTTFGVPNVLGDPTLELRDTNGVLLASNNDWQDNAAQASELVAVSLAPTSQLESAIAMSLPPGPYTALLSGLNNTTGVGIVEVYDLGRAP